MPLTPRKIQTKQELISFIFDLLDHNDAEQWENESAYQYLQALAGWLDGTPGGCGFPPAPIDTNTASWQLLADALQAAAGARKPDPTPV